MLTSLHISMYFLLQPHHISELFPTVTMLIYYISYFILSYILSAYLTLFFTLSLLHIFFLYHAIISLNV